MTTARQILTVDNLTLDDKKIDTTTIGTFLQDGITTPKAAAAPPSSPPTTMISPVVTVLAIAKDDKDKAKLFDPGMTKTQTLEALNALSSSTGKPKLFFSDKSKIDSDGDLKAAEIAPQIYAVTQYAKLVKQAADFKLDALTTILTTKKDDIIKLLVESKEEGPVPDLDLSKLGNLGEASHVGNDLYEAILGFKDPTIAAYTDALSDDTLWSEARYALLMDGLKDDKDDAKVIIKGLFGQDPLKKALIDHFKIKTKFYTPKQLDDFIKELRLQCNAIIKDPVDTTDVKEVRTALSTALKKINDFTFVVDDQVIPDKFQFETKLGPFIKIPQDKAQKIVDAINYNAYLSGTTFVSPPDIKQIQGLLYTGTSIKAWLDKNTTFKLQNFPTTATPGILDTYFNQAVLMTDIQAEKVAKVIIYQVRKEKGADWKIDRGDEKALIAQLKLKSYNKAGLETVPDWKVGTETITKEKMKNYLGMATFADPTFKALEEHISAAGLITKDEADDIIKTIIYQAAKDGVADADKWDVKDGEWDNLKKALMQKPFTQTGIGAVFQDNATTHKDLRNLHGQNIRKYLNYNAITGKETAPQLIAHLQTQQRMTEDEAKLIVDTIIYQAVQNEKTKVPNWDAKTDYTLWKGLIDKLRLQPLSEAGLLKVFPDDSNQLAENKSIGIDPPLTNKEIGAYLDFKAIGNTPKTAIEKHLKTKGSVTTAQSTWIADILDNEYKALTTKGSTLSFEGKPYTFDKSAFQTSIIGKPFTYQDEKNGFGAEFKKIHPFLLYDLEEKLRAKPNLTLAEKDMLGGLAAQNFISENEILFKRVPDLKAIFTDAEVQKKLRTLWSDPTKIPVNLSKFADGFTPTSNMSDFTDALKTDYTIDGPTLNHSKYNFVTLMSALTIHRNNRAWLSKIDNQVIQQFLYDNVVNFKDEESANKACDKLNKFLLAHPSAQIKDVISFLFEKETDKDSFAILLSDATIKELGNLKSKTFDEKEFQAEQANILAIFEACASKATGALDKTTFNNIDDPKITLPILKEFRELLLKNNLRFKDPIPKPEVQALIDKVAGDFSTLVYMRENKEPLGRCFIDDYLAPVVGTVEARNFSKQDFLTLKAFVVKYTVEEKSLNVMLARAESSVGKQFIARSGDISQLADLEEKKYAALSGSRSDRQALEEKSTFDALIKQHAELHVKINDFQKKLEERESELEQLLFLGEKYKDCIEYTNPANYKLGYKQPETLAAIKLQMRQEGVPGDLDKKADVVLKILEKEHIITAKVKTRGAKVLGLKTPIAKNELSGQKKSIEEALAQLNVASKKNKSAENHLKAAQKIYLEKDCASLPADEYTLYAEHHSGPVDIVSPDDPKFNQQFKDIQANAAKQKKGQVVGLKSGDTAMVMSGMIASKGATLDNNKQVLYYNAENQSCYVTKRQSNTITTTVYFPSAIEDKKANNKNLKTNLAPNAILDEKFYIASKLYDEHFKEEGSLSFDQVLAVWSNYTDRPMTYESAEQYLKDAARTGADSNADTVLGKFSSCFKSWRRQDKLAPGFLDATTKIYKDKKGKEVRMPKETYFITALQALGTERSLTDPNKPIILTGHSGPTIEAMKIICLALGLTNVVDYSGFKDVSPPTAEQARTALQCISTLRDFAVTQDKNIEDRIKQLSSDIDKVLLEDERFTPKLSS